MLSSSSSLTSRATSTICAIDGDSSRDNLSYALAHSHPLPCTACASPKPVLDLTTVTSSYPLAPTTCASAVLAHSRPTPCNTCALTFNTLPSQASQSYSSRAPTLHHRQDNVPLSASKRIYSRTPRPPTSQGQLQHTLKFIKFLQAFNKAQRCAAARRPVEIPVGSLYPPDKLST